MNIDHHIAGKVGERYCGSHWSYSQLSFAANNSVFVESIHVILLPTSFWINYSKIQLNPPGETLLMRHTLHHEYEMKIFIVRLILKLSPILQRGWQRGFISHKIFHSMFLNACNQHIHTFFFCRHPQIYAIQENEQLFKKNQ